MVAASKRSEKAVCKDDVETLLVHIVPLLVCLLDRAYSTDRPLHLLSLFPCRLSVLSGLEFLVETYRCDIDINFGPMLSCVLNSFEKEVRPHARRLTLAIDPTLEKYVCKSDFIPVQRGRRTEEEQTIDKLCSLVSLCSDTISNIGSHVLNGVCNSMVARLGDEFGSDLSIVIGLDLGPSSSSRSASSSRGRSDEKSEDPNVSTYKNALLKVTACVLHASEGSALSFLNNQGILSLLASASIGIVHPEERVRKSSLICWQILQQCLPSSLNPSSLAVVIAWTCSILSQLQAGRFVYDPLDETAADLSMPATPPRANRYRFRQDLSHNVASPASHGSSGGVSGGPDSRSRSQCTNLETAWMRLVLDLLRRICQFGILSFSSQLIVRSRERRVAEEALSSVLRELRNIATSLAAIISSHLQRERHVEPTLLAMEMECLDTTVHLLNGVQECLEAYAESPVVEPPLCVNRWLAPILDIAIARMRTSSPSITLLRVLVTLLPYTRVSNDHGALSCRALQVPVPGAVEMEARLIELLDVFCLWVPNSVADETFDVLSALVETLRFAMPNTTLEGVVRTFCDRCTVKSAAFRRARSIFLSVVCGSVMSHNRTVKAERDEEKSCLVDDGIQGDGDDVDDEEADVVIHLHSFLTTSLYDFVLEVEDIRNRREKRKAEKVQQSLTAGSDVNVLGPCSIYQVRNTCFQRCSDEELLERAKESLSLVHDTLSLVTNRFLTVTSNNQRTEAEAGVGGVVCECSNPLHVYTVVGSLTREAPRILSALYALLSTHVGELTDTVSRVVESFLFLTRAAVFHCQRTSDGLLALVSGSTLFAPDMNSTHEFPLFVDHLQRSVGDGAVVLKAWQKLNHDLWSSPFSSSSSSSAVGSAVSSNDPETNEDSKSVHSDVEDVEEEEADEKEYDRDEVDDSVNTSSQTHLKKNQGASSRSKTVGVGTVRRRFSLSVARQYLAFLQYVSYSESSRIPSLMRTHSHLIASVLFRKESGVSSSPSDLVSDPPVEQVQTFLGDFIFPGNHLFSNALLTASHSSMLLQTLFSHLSAPEATERASACAELCKWVNWMSAIYVFLLCRQSVAVDKSADREASQQCLVELETALKFIGRLLDSEQYDQRHSGLVILAQLLHLPYLSPDDESAAGREGDRRAKKEKMKHRAELLAASMSSSHDDRIWQQAGDKSSATDEQASHFRWVPHLLWQHLSSIFFTDEIDHRVRLLQFDASLTVRRSAHALLQCVAVPNSRPVSVSSLASIQRSASMHRTLSTAHMQRLGSVYALNFLVGKSSSSPSPSVTRWKRGATLDRSLFESLPPNMWDTEFEFGGTSSLLSSFGSIDGGGGVRSSDVNRDAFGDVGDEKYEDTMCEETPNPFSEEVSLEGLPYFTRVQHLYEARCALEEERGTAVADLFHCRVNALFLSSLRDLFSLVQSEYESLSRADGEIDPRVEDAFAENSTLEEKDNGLDQEDILRSFTAGAASTGEDDSEQSAADPLGRFPLQRQDTPFPSESGGRFESESEDSGVSEEEFDEEDSDGDGSSSQSDEGSEVLIVSNAFRRKRPQSARGRHPRSLTIPAPPQTPSSRPKSGGFVFPPTPAPGGGELGRDETSDEDRETEEYFDGDGEEEDEDSDLDPSNYQEDEQSDDIDGDVAPYTRTHHERVATPFVTVEPSDPYSEHRERQQQQVHHTNTFSTNHLTDEPEPEIVLSLAPRGKKKRNRFAVKKKQQQQQHQRSSQVTMELESGSMNSTNLNGESVGGAASFELGTEDEDLELLTINRKDGSSDAHSLSKNQSSGAAIEAEEVEELETNLNMNSRQRRLQRQHKEEKQSFVASPPKLTAALSPDPDYAIHSIEGGHKDDSQHTSTGHGWSDEEKVRAVTYIDLDDDDDENSLEIELVHPEGFVSMDCDDGDSVATPSESEGPQPHTEILNPKKNNGGSSTSLLSVGDDSNRNQSGHSGGVGRAKSSDSTGSTPPLDEVKMSLLPPSSDSVVSSSSPSNEFVVPVVAPQPGRPTHHRLLKSQTFPGSLPALLSTHISPSDAIPGRKPTPRPEADVANELTTRSSRVQEVYRFDTRRDSDSAKSVENEGMYPTSNVESQLVRNNGRPLTSKSEPSGTPPDHSTGIDKGGNPKTMGTPVVSKPGPASAAPPKIIQPVPSRFSPSSSSSSSAYSREDTPRKQGDAKEPMSKDTAEMIQNSSPGQSNTVSPTVEDHESQSNPSYGYPSPYSHLRESAKLSVGAPVMTLLEPAMNRDHEPERNLSYSFEEMNNHSGIYVADHATHRDSPRFDVDYDGTGSHGNYTRGHSHDRDEDEDLDEHRQHIRRQQHAQQPQYSQYPPIQRVSSGVADWERVPLCDSSSAGPLPPFPHYGSERGGRRYYNGSHSGIAYDRPSISGNPPQEPYQVSEHDTDAEILRWRAEVDRRRRLERAASAGLTGISSLPASSASSRHNRVMSQPVHRSSSVRHVSGSRSEQYAYDEPYLENEEDDTDPGLVYRHGDDSRASSSSQLYSSTSSRLHHRSSSNSTRRLSSSTSPSLSRTQPSVYRSVMRQKHTSQSKHNMSPPLFSRRRPLEEDFRDGDDSKSFESRLRNLSLDEKSPERLLTSFERNSTAADEARRSSLPFSSDGAESKEITQEDPTPPSSWAAPRNGAFKRVPSHTSHANAEYLDNGAAGGFSLYDIDREPNLYVFHDSHRSSNLGVEDTDRSYEAEHFQTCPTSTEVPEEWMGVEADWWAARHLD